MSQVLTAPETLSGRWHAVAGCIDHTLLKPESSRDQIVRLCEEAVSFGFAAVCVNPWWIALAADLLRGAPVRIATVIGFPLGANHTTVKRFEAEEAIRTGAHELDMVMNIGALKSGDRQAVQNDIQSIAAIAHGGGALLKVILETPLLTIEEKILGCELSLAAKADFIKTATGFMGAATVDDVTLLRGVAGDRGQIKASGGIRTAAAANAMIAAGASRIGASSSVAIVRELGAPDFSAQ